MAEKKIKKQRRRRRKKPGTYMAGIILVMTAAVVIGVGMFFLISDIIIASQKFDLEWSIALLRNKIKWQFA